MSTLFQGLPATKATPALAFLVGLVLAPASALSQTGTIAGTVSVSGTPPATRMLEVNKNQDVCGAEIQATDVVIENGLLAYGVAFVDGLEGEVTPQEHKLSNSGCSFDPPVMSVAAGSVLLVDN